MTTVLVPVAVDAVPASYQFVRFLRLPECHITVPSIDPSCPLAVAVPVRLVRAALKIPDPVLIPVAVDTLNSSNEAVVRAHVIELPIVFILPATPGARGLWSTPVPVAAESIFPVLVPIAMLARHTI